MTRIKKIHLPPTNLKGLKSYLRKRRFRLNPLRQKFKPRTKLTFDKPLPDGRRLHGYVVESKRRLYVKQHIDNVDPYRNPIGHLLKDYGTRHKTSSSVVKKSIPRKRRNKKTII